MRVISLLSAIIVAGALYLLVFERDAVIKVSKGAPIKTLLDAALPTDQAGVDSAKVTSGDDLTQKAESKPTTAAETQQKAQVGEETEQDLAIKVIAIKSQAIELDSAVILRGQTEAARQVELRAETTGQIISEPLRKGSQITKGDILCQLAPGTRNAQLTDAKARLAEARGKVAGNQANLTEAQAKQQEAEINLNAAEKLSKGGFASETRVAAAEAGMRTAEARIAAAKAAFNTTRSLIESAEAGVAVAEQEIDKLTIKAPFDGLLETDSAELGSLMQPGALCATIIQLDPIKLVGYVPETDIARVTLGAKARSKLISGQEVAGEVSFVSRSADTLTRTFRIDIDVPNPNLAISDGQTAEIMVASEGTMAHLLPQSALTLNDDGRLGVRLIDEKNRADFAPVTLLRDTAEGAWLKGLPNQARVILVGQEYVNSGVLVAPSYREAVQ